MAGVWRSDAKPSKVVENRVDGTIAIRINGHEQAMGTWQVRNGYLISSNTGNPAVTDSNKVLMLSQDTAILQSIDGHTPLIFHRQ